MSQENTAPLSPLAGPERVEAGAPFGRPTRKGSPEALSVSDAERVRAAFQAGDPAAVGSYLGILHPVSLFMCTTTLEWCYAWTAAVAELTDDDAARLTAEEVYRSWRSTVGERPEGAEALTAAAALLAPAKTTPQAAAEYRQAQMAGDQSVAGQLCGGLLGRFQGVVEALQAGDCAAAAARFEDYYAQARALHDVLVGYVWVYADVARQRHGQAAAEQAMADSFASCLFHEPALQLVGALTPEGRALFVAEHLRSHFSGPGRAGAAQVIEEPECYRIRFDPCGSGGVWRRALSGGKCATAPFAQATPFTWGRAGEVPPYCAHCAHNEIMSIERLGYPAWVTEFDPDPAKPCSWVLYKDPQSIPDRYFERLGIKRPEA